MLYLRATFSAVTPIWIFSNGSLSAVSIASTATRLPIFVPQRAPVITWGARLMLSAPPDTAMSHSPSAIICAAEIVDCTDDPHRRLTVSAGASLGMPAFPSATRAIAAPSGSLGKTGRGALGEWSVRLGDARGG